MSENKREIETRGQNVEEAVQKGLAKLGVSKKDVIIEVIDEGSRGLLGIGSRDAVVRLTTETTAVARPEPKPEPKPEPAPVVVPEPEAPPVANEVVAEAETPPAAVDDEIPVEEVGPSEQEAETAVEILRSMLEKMHVAAEVSHRPSEPDDVTGRRINVLDINGDDLGVLIGPRGETLNSLQYISRLMVGHKMQQRATFVIDVEGYRQRREQALSRLAERMAQKAVQRKRPVGLEPMPPNERRIIHMALRDFEGVYTESVGEGSRRKVRIYPE